MFLFELPLETLVILITPSPFLVNMKHFEAYVFYESKLFYKDNDILHLLALFKVFVILRAVLTKSIWYSDRAYRVCQIFSFELNYMFVIRCLMYHKPFIISFAWNIIGVLLFAQAVRLTEKPLKMATDRMDHSQYLHCIWEAFITMTTVGYGDFFPRTDRGRIVMVLCAVYGTVGFSLIVVSVTNIMQMSTGELRAYMLLKRVDHKKKMKKVSTTLIGKAVRYTLAKRTNYDEAGSAINDVHDIYEEYHEICEQYKELMSMISMEDKALYSFSFIHSNLAKLREEVESMCSKLGIDKKAVITELQQSTMHKAAKRHPITTTN